MANRRITIEAQFVDSTKAGIADLQRRLAQLEARMQASGNAAKNAGKKMQGFVGEETGKKLTRFNERTEKGKQLLTAFGGAAGGAAGQVVFYGGTIASVAGSFSKLELGIMGGIAAISALGYALIENAMKPARMAEKNLEELNKQIDEFINKARDASEAAFVGTLDTQAKIAREQSKQLNQLDLKVQKQLAFISELKAEREGVDEMRASGAGRAKQLDDQIKKQEMLLGFARVQIDVLQAEQRNRAQIELNKENARKREREDEQKKTKAAADEKRAQDDAKRARERAIALRKREREQQERQAELEAAKIIDIQQRARIERELDGFRGTAAEKQLARARALQEIAGSDVEKAQAAFNVERALAQVKADGIEEQKRLDEEYAEWQLQHAAKVVDIRKRSADKQAKADKDQAKFRNQIFQAGTSQLIGFVQAAEEGRLKELAKSSALQAIQQWAFYWGSLYWNPPAAKGHLASAILHTSFAAAAGIGSLAQSGGGGGGGETANAVTSARATGGVQAEEQEQEQNVVYIGNFFESEDANRELAARVDSANSRASFRGI